jgi:hypothetical protein
MKRTRIERPRARRERAWREALPPDPRDPDVIRAKALARAGRSGRPVTGGAVVPGGGLAASGQAVEGKPAATGINRVQIMRPYVMEGLACQRQDEPRVWLLPASAYPEGIRLPARG